MVRLSRARATELTYMLDVSAQRSCFGQFIIDFYPFTFTSIHLNRIVSAKNYPVCL